jgi:hypothetical protein
MGLFASGNVNNALLMPGSILQTGFTGLGFTVSSGESYRQRFRLLSEGEAVIAEFSLPELAMSGSLLENPLYFIPGFHSVDMQLLFASSGFWDELPEVSQAMLTEAYSRLFSSIDESTRLRETMLRQEIAEREMQHSSLSPAIRKACFDAWYAGFEPDPLRDYFMELISGV